MSQERVRADKKLLGTFLLSLEPLTIEGTKEGMNSAILTQPNVLKQFNAILWRRRSPPAYNLSVYTRTYMDTHEHPQYNPKQLFFRYFLVDVIPRRSI